MSEFKMPQLLSSNVPSAAQSGPNAQPLMYEEPSWSDVPPPSFDYLLEVIVQGSVLQTISLRNKPFFLIGRAPICDLVLDNDVRQLSIASYPIISLMNRESIVFLIFSLTLIFSCSTATEYLTTTCCHSIS